MAERPRHIHLPTTPPDPLARPLFTPHSELTPPQTGSIPPALSPLDAFAFQSRLLARKFEEEAGNGRRLSRLPHLTIQNEFSKARPAFVPSPMREMPSFGADSPQDSTPRGVEIVPIERPMSTHPTISMGHENGSIFSKSTEGFHNRLPSVDEDEQEPEQSYFPFPRSASPEALDTALIASGAYVPEPANLAPLAPPPLYALPVRPSPSSSAGLQPPSPPFRSYANSPTIRSVMEDIHSEDVDNLSLGASGSLDSFSAPKTPASPFRPQMHRSPSLASERSINSAGLSRPSMNYSRPLSRAANPSFELRRGMESPYRQDSVASASTRPSLEVPHRQDSVDSPITPLTNDDPHTPVSVSSEFFGQERPSVDASSSYTYAKYSLPRGKNVKRESLGIDELFNRTSALISWGNSRDDQDVVPANGPYVGPGSPPLDQLSKGSRKNRPADITIPRPSTETQSSPRQRKKGSRPSSPTTTISDASTIKARLVRHQNSNEITPEEHLQKGIECHESGSLQESTYHLRLAAKAGLSDAMLLYALACRHGWGMRPNPGEAVSWLQKAVQSAQLEVAQDEQTAKQNKPLDTIEKAKHKAQFALGVYELGMSYSKGWGVKQDKVLALRCFEVAGNWGDADALAEAGFCYAEGVGTKKDMKKAARFYRQAEAKGMSMAGNSWYVFCSDREE